jgi:hypothetical protein
MTNNLCEAEAFICCRIRFRNCKCKTSEPLEPKSVELLAEKKETGGGRESGSDVENL